MYRILLIMLVIVIIIYQSIKYREFYMNHDINYMNGVFLVRPPSEMSKYYIPYKNIMPTFTYENTPFPYPTSG
jgi:hypothetical protein